jgi:hypothetical protein
MMRRQNGFAAIALIVACASDAAGQECKVRTADCGLKTAVGRRADASAAGSLTMKSRVSHADEERVLPAVVVSVSPEALAVVNVPEPDEFLTADTVNYTVTPAFPGTVVGKLSGSITAAGGRRSIVLALRAPRRLPAGQVTLATVQFSAGVSTVNVPIIADITVRQGLTISSSSRMVAARAGSPVRIPWRVTNTGNAPDTVRVAAVIPAGWIQLDAPAPLYLGAQQGFDGSTILLPPPRAQGLTTIRLLAISRDQSTAESQVDIQVSGEWMAAGLKGPELRLGFAAAAGPWGTTTTMQSLELQGPVSDGLSLRVRAATSPGVDGATYALSRAGMLVTPFAFQLASPQWRLDGGTLGASVSDLAGTSLVGRGATFAVRQPGWSASVLAMTPDLDLANASGSMTASRFEVERGAYTMSAALSRLSETRGPTSRTLDAVALGGTSRTFLGGRLGAELAHRRHEGGNGAGWTATYLRRTNDESIDIRYAHAPGGSRAFARAAEELSLNTSRKITDRLHLSGGAWRSRDDGASLSNLHMAGWTFGANIAVAEELTFTLAGRESAFDAHTNLGAFGSGERGVDATMNLRRGWWSTQVTTSVANLSRTTTSADGSGAVFRQSAPRAGARGSLTLGSMNGTSLAWTGHYERVGPGVGAAPEQWSAGLRFTSRPSVGYRRPARLEVSAERVGGSQDAARSLMLHAALELHLPYETALLLSAERNPYVVPLAGSTDWIYVVGLTRSVSLPRIAGRGTRGVVYRDLNGNGRREQGEPGFAGVVLRRGSSVAVTDRTGSFLLAGDEQLPYELDARSLPVGWITPSTMLPATRRLVGAVAVSPLEVELQLDPADSNRVSAERLADVVVVARDSVGREWASRRVAHNRAVFDAVPPGSYTIVVDASASSEPLRPSGDLRATITTGRGSTLVRVIMRPRQLRYSSPRRPQ